MLHFKAFLFPVSSLLALGLSACTTSSVGPLSDHYDGVHFRNEAGKPQKGFWDVIKWQLTAAPAPWPEWVEIDSLARPREEVPSGQARVTWINHATLLLEFPEGAVLTDPVYSERVSPVRFAGPKRVHAPGIPWEALPKIAAVVVGHSHFDHMDLPTLERLAAEHQPVFIVGLGNAEILRSGGPALKKAEIQELDWWQETRTASGLRVVMTPAHHWSMRRVIDRDHALWGGYWIQGRTGASAYFAGDTGMGRHFSEIPKRLGPPSVSLLPIGAYAPRWFMKEQHIDPDDAVQALLQLGSPLAIGMHFGTFRLLDEGRDDPPRMLSEALQKHRVPPQRFAVLQPGEWRWVTPESDPVRVQKN